MMKLFNRNFLLVCIVVLACVLGRSTQAGAAIVPCSKDLVTIWPVGDSITYGSFGSNSGYRGYLYNLLSADMTNFLFVGSSTLNDGITTLPPAEQYNEGHAAYNIANIYTNLDGIDNSVFLRYHFSRTDGYWLTGIASGSNARPALHPDLILLLIGANDRGNPVGAQSRLDNLVSKLVKMRPNSHLIVARITPIATCRNFVNSYNQGVDAVVAKYSASNFVTEVDLNTSFPTNGFSSDNLHPNDIGYKWMASQWYNAIRAIISATRLSRTAQRCLSPKSETASRLCLDSFETNRQTNLQE